VRALDGSVGRRRTHVHWEVDVDASASDIWIVRI
jgi:hypothetical protein